MRRALVFTALGVACVIGVARPVHAGADGGSTQSPAMKVNDAAEAWYETSPPSTCSSPVGCPPASPGSLYPKDTLHAGQVGTTQVSATYVQPDMTGIPAGEQAVAGTMTLPLATVNGNGNANTAGATLIACLVTAPIKDGTAGSTAPPPSSNCGVRSPVKTGASSFTIDLAPFLQAWDSGQSEYGIALVANTSQNATWQVAFNGRNLAGSPHITSALTLAPAPSQGSPDVSGTIFAAPSQGGGVQGGSVPAASPGGLLNTGLFPSAPANVNPGRAAPVAQVPAIASPPAAPTAAPSPPRAGPGVATVAVSHGFQYPEILLLPLALAAGLVFVLRVLVSDATPLSISRSRRNPA